MRGLGLLVCSLFGCDSLASSDYVGQPLFTLHGTFVATTAEEPFGGLALLWQDGFGAGGPGLAVTPLRAAIEFPSAFSADVPTPPPDAARFKFGDADVELAEAYVFVVADAAALRVRSRGSDRMHVLVYASGEVADGTKGADYLGGPLTAGYHLRRFVPVATPAPSQSEMIERCVASGASHTACAARRAYQLGQLADDDRLRIVVAAP